MKAFFEWLKSLFKKQEPILESSTVIPEASIEEKPKPVVASGKKQPPFAKVIGEKMRERGKYPNGWPRGAVVHFTAGRDGAEKTIMGGIKNGYTFWCIQRDGLLVCAHDADKWGYHAGESKWDKVIKGIRYYLSGSVSDDLIGIEINAAGRVVPVVGKETKYQTWFGTYLTPEEVRYTPGKDNQERGFYHKYTPEQEHRLVETLFWLKDQKPDVFSFDYVLGHDEVAKPKGRKNDPGAALSMTMPEFREYLKSQYEKRKQIG